MTVSYSENDTIYFSEINTPSINVSITTDEELRGIKMYSIPAMFQKDSTMENYIHRYNYNYNFVYKKGAVIGSIDSTFRVHFMAYTDYDTIYEERFLKYKYEYPEIDSFDIVLSSDPTKDCLLNIKKKCAYKYSDYSTNNYDVVVINEDRKYWGYGRAFVSPDAIHLTENYFPYKFPSFPYVEPSDRSFRCTTMGIIHNATMLDKVTEAMVGSEGGWNQTMLLSDYGDEGGNGIQNLNATKLYKFQLYDGSYAVIRINQIANELNGSSTFYCQVFFQK